MWSIKKSVLCLTNGGTQSGSSAGIRTSCVIRFFARFGADLNAQSVLGNDVSASELRRKFIKSVLSVGRAVWFYFIFYFFTLPHSGDLLYWRR